MTDTRFSFLSIYYICFTPSPFGPLFGSCISPKWKIYVAAHRRPTNCIRLSLLRDINSIRLTWNIERFFHKLSSK